MAIAASHAYPMLIIVPIGTNQLRYPSHSPPAMLSMNGLNGSLGRKNNMEPRSILSPSNSHSMTIILHHPFINPLVAKAKPIMNITTKNHRMISSTVSNSDRSITIVWLKSIIFM